MKGDVAAVNRAKNITAVNVTTKSKSDPIKNT